MKYISNYGKFNETFLDKLFKGKKTEEKPTQPVKKQEVESNNPDHQLHKEDEVFHFGISDFAKFVKFCKEKKIYDLILAAADADKVLLGDNMKNETAWKNSFFDKDGDFNIEFTGSIASGGTGKDKIYYARVDANNYTSYPLAVYDEKLKKYVEY
jgi:hypothetical protein